MSQISLRASVLPEQYTESKELMKLIIVTRYRLPNKVINRRTTQHDGRVLSRILSRSKIYEGYLIMST